MESGLIQGFRALTTQLNVYAGFRVCLEVPHGLGLIKRLGSVPIPAV